MLSFMFFFFFFLLILFFFFFFFFNDPAPPEISPLPLHDALPILSRICLASPTPFGLGNNDRYHRRSGCADGVSAPFCSRAGSAFPMASARSVRHRRSEEHTSELQSPCNLVCRLLLEKKKKNCTAYYRIVTSLPRPCAKSNESPWLSPCASPGDATPSKHSNSAPRPRSCRRAHRCCLE